MKLTAISLFSSAGVGDLAFKNLPVDVLLSCELLEERHDIYSANFPAVECLTGDIWELKNEIIDRTQRRLGAKKLDILFATPPCQGMSKNGRGKLLQGIRNNTRPKLDPRNRLIIPTLDIALSLKPRIIILENVPEMNYTLIEDENQNLVGIIDYIRNVLGEEYIGNAEIVEFANYGVPQRRQRLITVFTRDEKLISLYRECGTFLPPHTHSEKPTTKTRAWVTVRDSISHLPPLDAGTLQTATSSIPLHSTPLLDKDKYFWVSNTPPGKSAFDNQCVSCGHQENLTHRAVRDDEGVNRASKETPINCVKCGQLLPRPWVREADGSCRLMKGYTSAYKRMSWDEPATALTTNFAYACSDKKVHPEQHRTLSIKEAMILHTLDKFDYKLTTRSGKKVKNGTIHEIIGESIPPLGLEIIFAHITKCSLGAAEISHNQPKQSANQLNLALA